MRLNFFKAIWGRVILLGFTIFVIGCAVKGEEQVLIIVDPESAVVTLGDTEQFESSPTDVTVTWSVEGILGGNEGTVGEIDSSGLYTAPTDTAKAPEKVSIEARDPSGSTGSATAFLTTFKPNIEITTPRLEVVARADTYSGGQRSIAVDGSNVYVVWADNSIEAYQVWFTKSTDGGDNFCDPIRLSEESSAANQFSPSVAVDNSGNVYVAWEDYRDGDGDIYASRFDGSDCPWTTSPFPSSPAKVNQSRDVGTLSKESSPAIAVDPDGVIYVAWEDRFAAPDEDYPDIYFARSDNLGQTFPTSTLIANVGRRPAIAIDSSGAAYVVWEDLTQYPNSPTHIMINKIESGTTRQIDSLSSPYHARSPSIAVGPGDTGERVYVIWQSARIPVPGFSGEGISSYDIDLAVLDRDTLEVVDTPPSFPDNLNAGFFGGTAYPSITADSDYIYAVWDDLRNETKDIYFSKSLAKSLDGVIFTTNRIVNDSTGGEWQWHEKPSIAASEGKAYVIWTDSRNISIDPTICPTGGPDICPKDVFFAREK